MNNRRVFGFASMAISLLILIVFAVSRFVQPILPADINDTFLLAVASVIGVLGVLASLNETVELISKIRESILHSRKAKLRPQWPVPVGPKVEMGNKPSNGKTVMLPVSQLRKPFFFTGKSGTGKTQTIFRLVKNLWKEHHIPFVVFELDWGSEYFSMATEDSEIANDVQFMTMSGSVPLGINPFLSYSNPLAGQKQEAILECFRCSYPWPANLFDVIGEAIRLSYQLHGFRPDSVLPVASAVPNMLTLYSAIPQAVDSLGSKLGDIVIEMKLYATMKLAPLVAMDKAQRIFVESTDSIKLESFLKSPTIIDLTEQTHNREYNVLGAFFVLSGLMEQLRTAPRTNELKLVIVLENIQRLIGYSDVSNLDDKEIARSQSATKFLHEFITLARECGVGIFFTTQRPTQISEVIVRDARNFLAFRVSGPEGDFLSGLMNVDDDIKHYLTVVPTGEGILYSDGVLPPTPLRIPALKLKTQAGSADTRGAG